MTVFRIWKYILAITDVQEMWIPAGAEFLAVAEQERELCLWAKVDPDADLMLRRIAVVGTGNPCQLEALFVGSVVMSYGLVWHVFDGGEA